jgi:hypothetical protein
VKPDVKPDTGSDADVKPDVQPDVPAEKPDVADAEVKPDVSEVADAEVKPDGDAATDGDAAKDAEVGTDADASETTPPVCPVTPVCTLGAKMCGTGGVQTCVTVSGCAAWSAAVACGGHQECTGAGNCTCIAAPGCTAEGKVCLSGAETTCAKDGACFFVSNTKTCGANQTCKAASGTCTCDDACPTLAAKVCNGDNTGFTTCADNGIGCKILASPTACTSPTTCSGGACICPAATAANKTGQGCTLGAADVCDGSDVLHCVTVGGCNIWQADTHCAANNAALTCGTKSGVAACQCQDQTGTALDVYVDPTSGSDAVNTGLFPTGVQFPPACRLKSLKLALAVENAKRVIGLHEGAADMPVTFTSDVAFPLVVKDGVTLMSSDNTPAHYIISATSGSLGIQLGAGSKLSGFRVRTDGLTTTAVSAIGNGASIDAVEVVKGSSAPARGVSVTGATVNAALNSVSIDGASVAGIDIVSAGATITGTSTVMNSATGVHVGDGTVDATNLVANLNGVGVRVDTSATAVFKAHGGTYSNSTAGAGINVSTGVLIVDQGAHVTTNMGNGIDSSAGANVTVSGSSVTTNTFGVFAAGSNTVTISGSDISSNRSDGVVGGSTTLTISGGSTITKNAGNGVKLNGASSAIFGTVVDSNTLNGIDINSPDGVTIVIGKAGSATALSNNTLAGLLIEKTLQTANHTVSTTLTNVDINNNKTEGLFVNPVAAADALFFVQDSHIHQNKGIGIRIKARPAQTTDSSFVHNEIDQNGNLSGNATGGILFEDSSILSTFQGNNVHNNTGNQVGFQAAQKPDPTRNPAITTEWNISGPAACSDLTKNNTFNGYVVPGSTGVFTSIVAITVDATYAHWQSGPLPGVDFSSGGGVQAIPACP